MKFRPLARKSSHRRLSIENLEDRRLMTISSFDAATGLLDVIAEASDDSIVISASDEETPRVLINGADPTDGALAAADVQVIHVTGNANTAMIDLSAVTVDDFSHDGMYTQIDFGDSPGCPK
jgi:hypothetical protein